MLPSTTNRKAKTGIVVLVILTILLVAPLTSARQLTLDQALDIAVNNTARGGMIRGNLEVAEQYYSARRINMYLPEISINGSLPSYSQDESYRFFGGSNQKSLFEERSIDFSSFVELKQTLFTGGELTATANLFSQDNRYPNTRLSGSLTDELNQQGFFRFDLNQPLFRPSSVKNELNNRKDDVEIAKMTRIQEDAGLKTEVTEAYVSVLHLTLKEELESDKLTKFSLKEGIDSLKYVDGVLSQEDFLLSSSERLDAELEYFSVKTELEEQKRELATLLDLDVSEDLTLDVPEINDHLDQATKDRLAAAWDRTVPIIKAEHEYQKAEREASYAASGHGLTGDLKASYSFGRGKVETELDQLVASIDTVSTTPLVTDTSVTLSRTTIDDDINTTGWSVALEFRLPIWDGGAGNAAVKAARFESERARYEFTRARRSARATILNLLNELDVSQQRLGIIKRQTELAANRLDIAKEREADGQISRLTFLDSRIFYLETRQKYLEELKKYLLNRIELDSQFIGT